MPEAAGLGGEIMVVDPIGRDDEFLTRLDLDAAGCERGELVGVVGQQPNAPQAELFEHSCGDEEVTFIGPPAKSAIGVDGIEAAILQSIST